MPEAAKAEAPKYPHRRKVLSFTTGDGGIDIPGWGTQTFVTPRRQAGRPAVGTQPDLELWLDGALGGVVVKLKVKGEDQVHLVPLAHIRKLELEE